MTIIHVGEGRHITLDEGAIFRPPPPVKPKYVQPNRVLSKPVKELKWKHSEEARANNWLNKMLARMGGKEWWAYKNEIIARYADKGRRLGEGPGIRRKKAGYAHGWAKRKAKKDLERIMKAHPETDEVAQEALLGALEVLRGPQSQGIKLQAAKLLLEFTKSKPVAKSEVSVNAAEQWLASLGKDD